MTQYSLTGFMCLFCTCMLSLVTFPVMFANCFDSPDGRARAKHLKFKTLNIYNKSVVLNHQHTAMEVTAADRLINESENKSSFQYPKLNSNLCALAPLVNGSRSEQNPLRAIRVFVPP